MRHYPKEFGGLLIGRYSHDKKTCYVTDTILPKKYSSSRSTFERGKEGLKKKLVEFYNNDPPLIYIGEWHTHPDSKPEPSETDKQAMQEISEHENVTIQNPILLIIGVNKQRYEPKFYLSLNNKLYEYE
ncbi:MAG: Mov34/MPN/PAD-1 family protein [Bacteroidia bacterium]|nr:Mov34/MPN/PAD-1 family protein [Bacteroidia bacterium]